ncbi:hypothetical protein BJ170DRAFT_584009 [Xylariales sp. AK1849]|nr:hypothetical protein BJ170DRAFT_584009 [Xylariales sp. AK1849]
MYDANIVDMLDVVDPEVATLSSITNIQNSLFIPSMGKWLNRRPTYNLSRIPPFPGAFPSSQEDVTTQPPGYTPHQQPGDYFRPGTPSTMGDLQETPQEEPPQRPTAERIPSAMTDRFFAVRPHDTSLADWSDEDLEELNDHVRHMLHSKRSKFKRRMKAFGQYVRRPLGFCVTLYATLITLFGLAWVLFLIGWIYVGEKQLYIINVIDLVLVALFAIVGDGMIPWRTVDTYHMIYIARYHHLTWKLRDRIKAPDLKDKNDLPHETVVTRQEELDLEAARNRHAKEELSVLTPEQQRKLEHHQTKFANSHTFYKPHETETHYAFPLRLLVAVVVLLDCHSCFQIALGLCTWCIDYRTRPGALTATILSCSIAVNTTAGILITIGDRRTRKKDVVERMFRQELTKEAMRRVQERKEKEAEKEAKKEAENNGLAKINEEDGKVRSSFDIGGLPKPTLDFLHSHKKSDDGSGKGIKRKPVPDQSRKSLDQVGRFSADTVYAPGWGSDAEASHQGTSSRPVVGAFPDEH